MFRSLLKSEARNNGNYHNAANVSQTLALMAFEGVINKLQGKQL